jgi:hypothetical protein
MFNKVVIFSYLNLKTFSAGKLASTKSRKTFNRSHVAVLKSLKGALASELSFRLSHFLITAMMFAPVGDSAAEENNHKESLLLFAQLICMKFFNRTQGVLQLRLDDCLRYQRWQSANSLTPGQVLSCSPE